MRRKQVFLADKQRTIRLAVSVAALTTVVSIVQELRSEAGIIALCADVLMLGVLLALLLSLERIYTSSILRHLIFCLFPLFYFPVQWIATGGIQGVGILYFFLFAIIVIYINPDRAGFVTAALLVVQIDILINLETRGLIESSTMFADPGQLPIHFTMVGLGVTAIFYHIMSHNNDLNLKYFQSAMRDELTGTYNRRYLTDHLSDRISESSGMGEKLHLIFFDLDDFKRINDEFGHETGDEVLQLFAKTARMNLRESDVIGRYGGDEFLVLLHGLDDREAENVAGRIRTAFADGVLDRFGISVTLSAGVEGCDGSSAGEILDRADRKMYREKRAHRRLKTAGDAN